MGKGNQIVNDLKKNLNENNINLYYFIILAYVKIHGCGNQKYKTKVIKNNLNPECNEVFHMTLESLEWNLKLFLDVYDEDINNDDFIGGLSVDLQQIIAKGSEEEVFGKN